MELFLPEVSDIILDKPFKSLLFWWFFVEQKRMGKIVLDTTVPYFREPVLVVLAGRSQKLHGNSLENVAWQMAKHHTQCIFFDLKKQNIK